MTKVSLIGGGYWGSILLSNLCFIPGISIDYIVEKDNTLLKSLSERFTFLENTKFTTDYKECFSSSEAVIIATPTSTHFKICKDCLENDLHIFIEKPITDNAKSAYEIMKLAEKKNKKICVDHVFLYNVAVLRIKELIDSGELGNIFYIKSERKGLGPRVRTDVNIIYDFAPHDISMILYWLSKDGAYVLPNRVWSTGKSYIDKQEDVSSLILEFPNDTQAHIFTSWYAPQKIRLTEIAGSKKMVIFDDVHSDSLLTIYNQRFVKAPQPDGLGFKWITQITGKEMPHMNYGDPLKSVLLDFFESIKKNKEPRANALQGLRVVQILDAANESMKKGGIPIKFSENYGIR